MERVSRAFYQMTFIGIVLIELVADELIIFVYGAMYSQAILVLEIILVGIGARFVLMPVFGLFSGRGSSLFSVYVNIDGLFVTVLLMCLLIPVFGVLGEGMTFSVGYVAALFVCYSLALRYLNLDIKGVL